MKFFFSLTLMLLLLAAITSCQKEIVLNIPSTDTTGGGGGNIPPSTNGELLIKLYGKVVNRPDSNVNYYTYNAAKQLVTRRNINSSNGGTNNWDGFERNAAGLIIRRKQCLIAGILPIQGDTSVTNYYYSAGATPQIIYSITSISIAGFSVNDSTVYSYNAAGKLTKFDEYQSDLLTGAYTPSQRAMFSFDGAGNVNKLDLYSLSGGAASLVTTQSYTYDSKLLPQTFTEAEFVAMDATPAFAHNVTKNQTNNYVAGAGNITSESIFTYNSANRPATAKQTTLFNSTTTTTNFTYYYQ